MIGGKPNLAYYFVGIKEPNNLIYLDPHVVHSRVRDVDQCYDRYKRKFHTSEARYINMEKMDPCLGFGFLIKDKADYDDFMEKLNVGIFEDEDNTIF